jgi:cytidyltransferase-like protein
MAHGRFQPFHLGHLEYVRLAAARCELLLVGITNPDRDSRRAEAADPLRHLAESNPYTYTERLWMVERSLVDEALAVSVIPFPVSEPERWPDYVPAGTVHFLRVFDEWGRAKVERLRGAGFDVVVLDEGAAKRISGAEVRACLRAGSGWERLVPRGTASVLQEVGPR